MRRDFSIPPKPPKKKWPKVLGAFLIIATGWFLIGGVINHTPEDKAATHQQRLSQPAFPAISTNNLSSTQRKILTLARTEYDKAPRHFDSSVLKYTEGTRESWCADFISWVFLKADVPLTNPNSNYWRIPGVLTLQKYYKDAGAYVEATAEYTPKLGDVVFYIGAQTPDNSSDEHVALVLKVEGDVITTIGGNEGDGIMRIRAESPQKSLVGFGRLDS